jgi:hypothetical protein
MSGLKPDTHEYWQRTCSGQVHEGYEDGMPTLLSVLLDD